MSLWKFSVVSWFLNVLYGKNENPETPEIDRKLSKSIKHPVLTVSRYQKTAKKQSVYYLCIILALITRRAIFKQ